MTISLLTPSDLLLIAIALGFIMQGLVLDLHTIAYNGSFAMLSVKREKPRDPDHEAPSMSLAAHFDRHWRQGRRQDHSKKIPHHPRESSRNHPSPPCMSKVAAICFGVLCLSLRMSRTSSRPFDDRAPRSFVEP